MLSDDWLDQIKSANVSVLFSWPYSTDRVMRDLYQSRAYLINKFLSIQLVPSFDESWFYENKAKLADFLKVKGYSHPQTHVFYRKEDATEFANISKYPVVFKTDIGALSSGVIICKSVNEAQKLINKCFGKKGYTNASIDYRDKQWGYIIFQECITDAKEWRMVQIGDSVMCRIKEKIGEYHSGSGKVEWGKPSKRLLDLFWSITEKENFKSVNIDFFEDSVGNYLINEIHPVFGDILKNNLVKSSGLMGRYLKTGEDWIFEPGYFYENACADLRLEYYIENIII